MDNVVQNISIRDIVSSHFQPTNEESRKIEELAQLIKNFGLIDPILVRPHNGKYEIVLGMDKYQAALIANLNTIPAIIKEVDDETFSKYSSIDNNQAVSLNSLSPEQSSPKEKNSDVINLSELSKIKLEYERDDLKMNNTQFNNDLMNNNFGQPTTNQSNQGPTFGGRFFPSLEDEPTNMNMMEGLNAQPSAPELPNLNSVSNNTGIENHLIDLTDLSLEKEQTSMPSNDFGVSNMNISTPEPTLNINNVEPQIPNINVPTPEPALVSSSTNDTIINLNNLQNNNPAVQPISEPVSMETLNADFGAPTPVQPTPQFDMVQNTNLNIPQNPSFNEVDPTIQTDFGIDTTPVNPQPVPNFDTNIVSIPDFGTSTINVSEPTLTSSKDVTPVTSTIKDLAINLEKFGYKINIIEEDLPTSAKITIEVVK